MSQPDDMEDALDNMMARERAEERIAEIQARLQLVSQLLTCAIASMGGEMAVTTTEIERATQGQQISLRPLPNNRGFYAALTSYAPGGNDVVPAPAPAADVRNPRYPDS